MVDYSGNDLKADIESVWETVVKAFPNMASAYRSANISVHGTKDVNDVDVEFLGNWGALRDELEYILADSAEIFHETAEAICSAMKDYAKSDSEAAAALQAAQKDLPNNVPDMGETTIPESGRYYASDDYYNPKVPTHKYSGSAPTVDELIEQAKETEDKLWGQTYGTGMA